MNRRSLASVVAGATVAAALVGAIPSATGQESVSSADSPRPSAAGKGVESVGPIATIAAASGSRWPAAVPSVAVLPRGSVFNGEYPSVYVPSLTDLPTASVRLVDLVRAVGGSDGTVWSGTAAKGWFAINQRLAAGRAFGVDAQSPDGWVRVGTFTVAPPGPGAGPSVSVGGMQVASVDGAVAWAWDSPTLPGPATSASVRLSWGSGVTGSPGVPEGWRVTAQSGSPWAHLTQSTNGSGRATALAPSVDVTQGTARVDLGAQDPTQVQSQVVQVRTGAGGWRNTARVAARGGSAEVSASAGMQVRTCLDVDSTQLCSAPTTVGTADGLYRAPVTRAAVPASGVQSGSGPRAVTLTGWDGTTLLFERTAQGLYEQVTGAGRVPGLGNTLDPLPDGSWEFTDSAGTTTKFSGGNAVSVEANGLPVSRLSWDATGRFVGLSNEIGRTIRLVYAGSGDCPSESWTVHGFAAPAQGSLCRIDYPHGSATDIGYVTAGASTQVALIKDSGNVSTALGWDAQGRLVAERSSLVGRAAMVDPSAASVVSRVEYDARGRAARLVSAAATAGASGAVRTLDFPRIDQSALRAWVADPSPANQAVTQMSLKSGGYDLVQRAWIDPTTWQSLRSQDRAGLGVKLSSDAADARTQVTVDEQGRVSRIKKDELGRTVSTAGPSTQAVTRAAGQDVQTTTTEYDLQLVRGQEERLAGLRAQVFPQDGLGGRPDAQFWQAQTLRGGLSYRWSDMPAAWSALATGVWRPSAGDDSAGAADGWTFRVDATGARVLLMVGSVACEPAPGSTTCSMQLPATGPKQVTVQLTAGRATGSFSVSAAPVGQAMKEIEFGKVRPEYSNPTIARSNDTFPGSARTPQTTTNFADPASGKATSVTDTAGRRTAFTYEPVDPAQGHWGRSTAFTTAGGEKVSTAYWADSGTVALPAACGAGEAVLSGQPSTVTRQDGSSVTTYYDVRGQVIAAVTQGTGAAQVQCTSYFVDGSVREQSTYAVDDSGRAGLLERSSFSSADPGAGGDPMTSTATVVHGSAAPVAPGVSVTSSVTIDLRGLPVRSTDASGTIVTTAYDAVGQATSVTYDPPGTGPSTTVTYVYRSTDGAPLKVVIGSTTAASITYNSTTGKVSSVEYPGSSVGFTYGPDGRILRKSVTSSSGDRYVDQVQRTDFGRTLSGSLTAPGLVENRNYSYDAAGRLTRVRIATTADQQTTTRTFDYAFAAAQDASCSTSYREAGLDNLRTGGVRDGVAYVTCHDGNGRITSTTDPLLTEGSGPATFVHDGLGRVTRIGGVERPVSLTYGIGGDLVRAREAIDSTTPVTTEFTSFAGSVLTRSVTSATGTSATSFGAGGVLQLATDDSGAITGLSAVLLDLPGGARATIPVGGKASISHTGIAAAALATIPAVALGNGSGDYAPASDPGLADRVGPYGERLGAADTDPDVASPTYLWQAATRADTLPGSSGITVVGARSYLPAVGEFLTMDPVIDSGQNLYGYTDGDPINANDVSGNESQDDMMWTWIAAAAAGTALILGLVQPFVPYSTKFMNAVQNGAFASRGDAYKGVLRLSPAKTVVMSAMIGLSAAAGVATAMALRNQVSETWQTVLIGIGAGAAMLGVSFTATFAVAKVRAWRQVRRAAPARQSVARPVSTSSVDDLLTQADQSLAKSVRPPSVDQPIAVQPESAFALRRCNGQWDQINGQAVFIKTGPDGARNVLEVNKL